MQFARPLSVTLAVTSSPSLPISTKLGLMNMAFRPALPASVPVELSRVMLPDDTNPSGNVHGGTILKLIEQAGQIVATCLLYTSPSPRD